MTEGMMKRKKGFGHCTSKLSKAIVRFFRSRRAYKRAARHRVSSSSFPFSPSVTFLSLQSTMEDERETASLRRRAKKKSSISLSCCFHGGSFDDLDSSSNKPSPNRSPSMWRRSKCRNRRHSYDFSYDPLSYALNFDEGGGSWRGDESPLTNFNRRLAMAETGKSTVPTSEATPTTPPPMSVELAEQPVSQDLLVQIC